jgi:hypothetical protein
MTPRPTHRRSPVSTASSAASATASPRSDWDGHREQERGQRRFCAPHFLHIAMASFSPCLRTARTRQPCPTVHRLRSGSRRRDPGSFPPDARSSLNPYRSTRQAAPRPAETVSHRRGHGPPHEHPVAPQRPLSAVPPPLSRCARPSKSARTLRTPRTPAQCLTARAAPATWPTRRVGVRDARLLQHPTPTERMQRAAGERHAERGRPLPRWVRERPVGHQQRELTLPTSLPLSRPPQM